jgi:hypothetical protein
MDLVPYDARRVTVTNQVSASELGNLIFKQKRTRIRPFVHMAQICYARLKRLAESGAVCGSFEVPLFMSGLPLYDAVQCAEFIACHLKTHGYEVTRINPRLLHIHWASAVPAPSPVPAAAAVAADPDFTSNPGRNPKPDRGFFPSASSEPRRAVVEIVERSQRQQQEPEGPTTMERKKTRVQSPSPGLPGFKSIALLKPSGRFALSFN